jgi:C-terminal processing protease CtpA/Prc
MSFDSGRATGIGIGAVLSPAKGRVKFLSLDPACGAHRAGIRKHELLESIEVGGHNQIIESVAQAAALVKGEPGTSVKMVIRHASNHAII